VVRVISGLAGLIGFIGGAMIGYFAGMVLAAVSAELIGLGAHDAGGIYLVIGFGTITPALGATWGMIAARRWAKRRSHDELSSRDSKPDE
jgi:hypothetical protein